MNRIGLLGIYWVTNSLTMFTMTTTMFNTLKLNQMANIWKESFISYDLDETVLTY